MKAIIFLVVLAAFTEVAFSQGTLNRTVLPLGLESRNGNAHDAVLRTGLERQQWFRNDYVAQALEGAVFISEIAFRVNEGALFSYDATIPRVEVQLGVTYRPAALLDSWEVNTGTSARVVFDRTSVRLTSPGGPGPNAFGLRLVFDQPYYYDPTAGHLMLLVRTQGAFIGGNIDSEATATPLLASPFALVARETFEQPVARALVVEFTWSQVPEPAPTFLGLLGVLLFMLKHQTKRS